MKSLLKVFFFLVALAAFSVPLGLTGMDLKTHLAVHQDRKSIPSDVIKDTQEVATIFRNVYQTDRDYGLYSKRPQFYWKESLKSEFAPTRSNKEGNWANQNKGKNLKG